jgi:hypothetical protein
LSVCLSAPQQAPALSTQRRYKCPQSCQEKSLISGGKSRKLLVSASLRLQDGRTLARLAFGHFATARMKAT